MALEFIAGCVGGCAGVAVGHPFDTIKVRLQTQDAINPKYRGTWDCFSSTLRAESVRGLYKGMSSPMAGVSVVNAIVFGVHGNIMKNVKDPSALGSHAMAGGGAGFVQAFISSPVELAKTRMQIQSNAAAGVSALYKSPLHCLRTILKYEGVRGLLRGQKITIFREIPGFASYFASYEFLLNKFTREGETPGSAAILMAGGLAGTVSWLITYPIDVVKSRIQADGMNGDNKYRGIWHCFRSSVSSEGMSSMTRGLSSTLIRAFPTNAATFTVVTWVMNLAENTDITNDASMAWKEVLARGEVLLSTSLSPIANKLYPTVATLKTQREHLLHLERIAMSNLIPECSTFLKETELER